VFSRVPPIVAAFKLDRSGAGKPALSGRAD